MKMNFIKKIFLFSIKIFQRIKIIERKLLMHYTPNFPSKEKNNLAFPSLHGKICIPTNLLFMLNRFSNKDKKPKSKIKNKIMGNI